MNSEPNNGLAWVTFHDELTVNQLQNGDTFVICTGNSFYSFTYQKTSDGVVTEVNYIFNGVTDKKGNTKESTISEVVQIFQPTTIKKGENVTIRFADETGSWSLKLSKTKAIFLRKATEKTQTSAQDLTQAIIKALLKHLEEKPDQNTKK